MWWPWQGERCYCQSMWQLIASNTVNDQCLPPFLAHAAPACSPACSVAQRRSAGYILLTLSSLAIYFISLLLYTWQMRLGSTSAKISGSEAASNATAVCSSLAFLSSCHSLVWHPWGDVWYQQQAATLRTTCPNTSPRRPPLPATECRIEADL